MKKSRIIFVVVLLLLAILATPFLVGEAKDLIRDAQHASTPRTTEFPASVRPDQVCLTWSGDPCTTQTVQWRTAPAVAEGVVQYHKKREAESLSQEVAAACSTLADPLITNDPSVHRFTATMTQLEPATRYAFRVGNKPGNAWSEWFEFRTAPRDREAFSFVYLGDAQVGFPAWGQLLHAACKRCPNAAFVIMAGDLANRGNDRDDWDSLFDATRGVLDRRPVVPAIGNHECPKGAEPRLYLDQFALPENGPENVPRERVYSLQYSNALFVVLDPNLPPEEQRAWLDKQLASADAAWKFAVFHQPAYSSAPHRDNPEIRKEWCDLFDKYHVDMAFSGHDHAYLRTHPMKAGRIVASPAEGTIYIIADSGSKFYEQVPHDYTAVGFGRVSTYQVVDIETKDGDKLTYRAYDMDGKVRDEIVIAK